MDEKIQSQRKRVIFKPLFIIFLLAGTGFRLPAQTLIIPGETGYSRNEQSGQPVLPVDEGGLVLTRTPDTLVYYAYFRTKGELKVEAQITTQPATLEVEFAGKKAKRVNIDKPLDKATIPLCTVMVTDTGFQRLIIIPQWKTGTIRPFILHQLTYSGTAIANIQVNRKPRRNAASVHLWYTAPEEENITGFYNEITVPPGADHLHTYYMACGFARGYFGIQVNNGNQRRVIFSVWDAGDEKKDRKKVTTENLVQLIAVGQNVVAGDFGNEGTGGHSHWIYPWKTGETYRFYVAAVTDSATQSTSYTAYFYIPEEDRWKLIASYRAPKDNKYLRGLYSFSENFYGLNGDHLRKAYFGRQWVRTQKGDWKELTTARFTTDATGKNGDRIDIGAGTDSNRFYLWHGGYLPPEKAPGVTLNRTATTKPTVDLFKNADSIAIARRDSLTIVDYYTRAKMENVGRKDGIYYYIIQPGSKRKPKLTDTVKVYYRGNLADGTVFDKSGDEEPAIFPLNRLIKGWQTGIPLIGEGGRIQLMLPSAQAYGMRNLGVIPPNSVLIFDIELVGIKD